MGQRQSEATQRPPLTVYPRKKLLVDENAALSTKTALQTPRSGPCKKARMQPGRQLFSEVEQRAEKHFKADFGRRTVSYSLPFRGAILAAAASFTAFSASLLVGV